jgi:hypothetical protein
LRALRGDVIPAVSSDTCEVDRYVRVGPNWWLRRGSVNSDIA